MRGLILSVILIITVSLRVVGAFVLRVHTAYITGRLSTTMTTSSGRSIARHSIMYATNDKGNDPAQHEWNPSWSAIGGSDMYSEERPRRLVLPNKESGHSDQYREERFSNDWGIQQIQGPRVEFPSTIEDVTEQAFEAIAATLYGKQRMDPNLVRNAVKGDTVHGRRPVRSHKDSGRIGIEIAGAKYLFVKSARLENLSPEVTAVVDAFALRRVALTLASKLTRGHWIGFEPKPQSPKYHRPVILYFNQVKQALAASQDLSLLRRKAMLSDCPGIYDNITIVSMSGDAKIPKELCNGHQKQRKHTMLPSGGVDPSRGILVFVQPTDYNEESRPPGPAVGAFEAFQKLVACAAIEELPVLCISPRFLAIDNTHSIHHWDQSGFQQSSTYGGVEPPRVLHHGSCVTSYRQHFAGLEIL